MKSFIIPQNIFLPALFAGIGVIVASCNHPVQDLSHEYTLADTTLMAQLADSAHELYDQSRYYESLSVASQALPIAEALCDSDYLTDLLNTQMTSYTRLQISDSALLVGQRLLGIDKLLGDESYIATDYQTIAAVYLGNKEYQKAREYIELSIQHAEKSGDDQTIAVSYGVASEIACAQDYYDEAFGLVYRAYELDSIAQRPLRVARRLAQIAEIYTRQKKTQQAIDVYMRAVGMFAELGELHSLGISCRNLGSLYWTELRDPEQARPWLEKAEEITTHTGELGILVDTYKLLADVNENRDWTLSQQYLDKFTQLRDSLVSVEKERALLVFDAQQKIKEPKIMVLVKRPLWMILLLFVALLLLFALGYQLRILIGQKKQLTIQIADFEEEKAVFLAQLASKGITTTSQSEQGSGLSETDREFVNQVNSIISDLMESADLTAESIAEQLCITSQQLRRRLQAICGVTTSAYITQIRFEFAKQLLAHSAQFPVAEVARRCGFEEPNNFSRAFKQQTGMSPSQYRNSLKS